MMHYTNRDQFIVSAAGCMYTEPDSLESIMAGNENGASGCSIPLDLTQDNIAVLCARGGFRDAAGAFHPVGETDFIDLRRIVPKLVTVGQALELAKSCAAKICVQVKDATVCPHAKIALAHADYVDNAYFGGLNLSEAAIAANKNPALHIMGDVTSVPADVMALIRAAQDAGLFGLRADPDVLTPALCEEALRCGLFLAATNCVTLEEMESLLARGVNFIETEHPDLVFSLKTDAPEEDEA